MGLSTNARTLILDYEVGGGRGYYEKFLARPSWPGVASGVTIGIGYDLGYHSPEVLRANWNGVLTEGTLGALATACGKKGNAAAQAAKALRAICVPWEAALRVFDEVTVPRWISATLGVFPGADALPEDAFGALVSLVFNRGIALEGGRRAEMRAIRALVRSYPPGSHPYYDQRRDVLLAISAEIREMKRLWPSVKGLLRRRDAEAALVERAARGLA